MKTSTRRALLALLLCAAACAILSGTLLIFFRPEASAEVSPKTLTFAKRVAYQRAIEEVYWRHRIWPKERSDPKPSLDAVMSEGQLEKKVAGYLRKSQALEEYWQRPITAEQLQAEMDRMAKNTKQPEVLRELFAALGNDPFVIAECLGRPALAGRLLTNWYAYDQRIHGHLKQRAEADLQVHSTIEQMKQTSGTYSEIELIKSANGENENNAGAEHRVKLNSREWDETVQKIAAMFRNTHPLTVAASGFGAAQPMRLPPHRPALADAASPASEASMAQIKTGVVSPLQEDETRYYVAAVMVKAQDHLELATVSWLKESFESWQAREGSQFPKATTSATGSYTLPQISSGPGECIDDTWAATMGPPEVRDSHTAVWTGNEMILWGGFAGNGTLLNTGGRYNPATDTWVGTSTLNAPSARFLQTAVWTGSEMIVWGGYDGTPNGYFNTGGRYNPSTDRWAATSTINAPLARFFHTAVWTGSEMIIWGGQNSGVVFNTGGRYNPVADSWTATSLTNVPAARFWHVAVWTGSEMIIWGGSSGPPLNTGGRYNPSSDSWTVTSSTGAPSARLAQTAVWTGIEMITWGGCSDLSCLKLLNTGGRYDPIADSWTATSTGNAPAGRYAHTAIWTDSEMIVWGGIGSGNVVMSTGGRYNPSTDIWTATSITNAPVTRFNHTAVWTGSEMIVWGGSYLNTGGKYDPNADSWTDTGTNNAPSARSSHTATWTGSEMIIWGGVFFHNGALYFNTGGRYDPATDSWIATNITNAPSSRSGHSAVWTGSEMIVWGGAGEPDTFNTGGRYNPISDDWTATSTSNAPVARVQHTAVWTGNEMIVWGGYGCGGNCNLNSGGRYNPTTDIWVATSVTNVPSARWDHTAVWTGSEMIVWGGTDAIPNHTYLHTGGRYNPADDSWMPTTLMNVPLGRISHTAVWAGSEMVVWGGVDETFNDSNSGGRYNPSTDGWTATTLADAPSARDSHTAVWTGIEMIVWGGIDTSGLAVNTGGRYDAKMDSWIATSITNAPIGRLYHSAVWAGIEMIVWGGDNEWGHLNSGGRYCAQFAATPTPTATPTATATPTPTPSGTPTPRITPTPRPRPTPASRPTPR